MPEGDPLGYAFLTMGDLSSQEKMLAAQQAQAQTLRNQGMQPSSRRDFGSQLSRAVQGFGGMVGQRRYDQGMKDFGLQKQVALDEIRRALMPQKPVAPGALPAGYVPPEDVPPGGPY